MKLDPHTEVTEALVLDDGAHNVGKYVLLVAIRLHKTKIFEYKIFNLKL